MPPWGICQMYWDLSPAHLERRRPVQTKPFLLISMMPTHGLYGSVVAAGDDEASSEDFMSRANSSGKTRFSRHPQNRESASILLKGIKESTSITCSFRDETF